MMYNYVKSPSYLEEMQAQLIAGLYDKAELMSEITGQLKSVNLHNNIDYRASFPLFDRYLRELNISNDDIIRCLHVVLTPNASIDIHRALNDSYKTSSLIIPLKNTSNTYTAFYEAWDPVINEKRLPHGNIYYETYDHQNAKEIARVETVSPVLVDTEIVHAGLNPNHTRRDIITVPFNKSFDEMLNKISSI